MAQRPLFEDALPNDPGDASSAADGLARDLGLTRTFADVLTRRGLTEAARVERFLDPKLAELTSPDGMLDRALAAERLARAVRARERVCVFGDYDCDGITATAILTDGLRALGGEVSPQLATRAEGAYGLSWPAFERVRATGATLLVTCDCGSSDHERIEAANRAGIDVVVIDHHLVPKEALPALAFLNPHRPECAFPFKGLASCGLAMSVIAAVRKLLGSNLDVRRYLDLVAIGTIADVAPLVGDNRALVRAGMRVLRDAPRPGIAALALSAERTFSYREAEDISFQLAPRLNAPGRIGNPDDSLALLLETDGERARSLAATIEQAQRERRSVQDVMLGEALAEIEASAWGDAPGIVVARQGWHPGVVGIAAGRIASTYERPTIVIGLEGEHGRGSVRGPSGFPLYDALCQCRDVLVGFGGHQAAAGVHVRADRIEALRGAFADACEALGAARYGGQGASADARLDPRDAPERVADELARLEPCGEGNRAPLILLRGARVTDVRTPKGHLSLGLSFEGRTMRAFGFSLAPLADVLTGQTIDLVGRLRRDTFRGGDAVDVRIERIGRAT